MGSEEERKSRNGSRKRRLSSVSLYTGRETRLGGEKSRRRSPRTKFVEGSNLDGSPGRFPKGKRRAAHKGVSRVNPAKGPPGGETPPSREAQRVGRRGK